MSFASEVKKELLNIDDLPLCCQRALLFGLLQGSGDIILSNSGLRVVAKSNLLSTINVINRLLKSIYNITTVKSYSDEHGLEGRRFYYLEISENAENIISDFKLMPFTEFSVNDEIIKQDCCKGSFIRGLFIAKGSINDPRKSCYHLEISSSSDEVINTAKSILKKKGIDCKLMERRNMNVLYIKKSEDISSVLALMGAKSGVFYFEDQRIVRDVNNMANRMTNCDIANEVRCAKSCDEQLQAISYIRSKGHFEKMPQRLQDIARLREENPDSSLDELSFNSDTVFNKQLSKSGISHCVRALMNYYNDLKKIEEVKK